MMTVKEFSCREVTKRPTTTRDLIERFKAVGPETEQGKALHGLATRMLDIFKDEKKPSYSNEASPLSTILSGTDYVSLLEAFINAVSRGAVDVVGPNVSFQVKMLSSTSTTCIVPCVNAMSFTSSGQLHCRFQARLSSWKL